MTVGTRSLRGRWETSSCLPILRIHVPFPGGSEGSITAPWHLILWYQKRKVGQPVVGFWESGPFSVAAVLQKRSCQCHGLGDTKGIGRHGLVPRLCGHLGTGRVELSPAQCFEPRDADTWASFSGVLWLHHLGKVQNAPLITQNTEGVWLCGLCQRTFA